MTDYGCSRYIGSGLGSDNGIYGVYERKDGLSDGIDIAMFGSKEDAEMFIALKESFARSGKPCQEFLYDNLLRN